jgi:hypothetical protein
VSSAADRSVQEKIRSPAIGFGKDVVEGAHHCDAFEKAMAQDLIDADTDYSDGPVPSSKKLRHLPHNKQVSKIQPRHSEGERKPILLCGLKIIQGLTRC